MSLNGTALTASVAELNLLDGVTASTAELNLLDGVTASTAELNLLDGVTALATFGTNSLGLSDQNVAIGNYALGNNTS